MDRTVAENLKEMKNCLLRMREQLALQSPDFEQMEPASRLHPLFSINVEEQREHFLGALSGIRQRLEPYLRRTHEIAPHTEVDLPLNRLAHSLKECAARKAKVTKLQTTLSACQHLAMRYLAKRNTLIPQHQPLQPDLDEVSPVVVQQQRTLQQQADEINRSNTINLLRIMKERVPGIEGVYVNDSGSPDVTVFTFSAPSFLVNISVNSKGAITQVTCEVNGERDTFFTIRMSEILRDNPDFAEFEHLLRELAERFKQINELRLRYPNLNINEIICALEHDLQNVTYHEQSIVGLRRALQHYHGLLRRGPDGITIYYYVHPSDLAAIDNDTIGSLEMLQAHLASTTLPEAYTAKISLELGSVPVGQLPQSSSIQRLFNAPTPDDLLVAWNDITPVATLTSSAVPPVNFFLTLDKPIPMRVDLLYHTLRIAYGGSKHIEHLIDGTNTKFGVPYTKLLALHYGGAVETPKASNCLLESIVSVGLNEGAPPQRYFVPRGEQPNAVLVQRLPFTHLSQLLPILRLVRQQVVANELFLSCMFPRQARVHGEQLSGRKRKRSALNSSDSHSNSDATELNNIQHVELRCLPSSTMVWQISFLRASGPSADAVGAKRVKISEETSTPAGTEQVKPATALVTLEIHVRPNGEVKVVGSENSTVDFPQLEHLLQSTLDIPHALLHIMQSESEKL